MAGYVKLFDYILDSSVWIGTPKYVKVLWITILAKKDKNGDVISTMQGLEKASELSQEEVEKAMVIFLSPDLKSSTKEMEGRRLIPIDRGWHVVTHDFYKKLMSREEALENDAERKRRERAAAKKG